MKKEEFIQAFKEQYGGYIYVDDLTIGEFYDKQYQNFAKRGFNDTSILGFCSDYILSQGLVEEVVE